MTPDIGLWYGPLFGSADYLVPLETAYPEANREALVDLAAAQYARDWLADMRHRIAARALTPLE